MLVWRCCDDVLCGFWGLYIGGQLHLALGRSLFLVRTAHYVMLNIRSSLLVDCQVFDLTYSLVGGGPF